MSITLAELRTQARQRSDMEKSKFVKDSELNSYINNSIAELHDLLSEAYGSEYYVKLSSDIPVISGQDSYNLPDDFYELKGVDIKLSNDFFTVDRFNFNERNRYSTFGAWTGSRCINVKYRIVGDTVKLLPMPDQSATLRFWYVPTATILVNDSDTLKDYNAYSEYVIVDAAIKMMQKEESDVSVLLAQKQALIDRIRGKAMQRDASKSGQVSDIYAENDDFFYWRNGF